MTGNYRKLVEHHERLYPPDPDRTQAVEILHDTWCDFMHLNDGTPRGPCNCSPDVITGPLIDKKYGHASEPEGTVALTLKCLRCDFVYHVSPVADATCPACAVQERADG